MSWPGTGIPEGFIPARDLAARARISYRQIDHWIRRDLIAEERVPTKSGGTGSGVYRLIPAGEIEVVEMAARMVRAGIDPTVAVAAARTIRASGEARLPGGVRITLEGES